MSVIRFPGVGSSRSFGWVTVFLIASVLNASNGERIGPSSRRTGLTLSEILREPFGGRERSTSEFIELYNADLIPVSLAGFRIEGSIRFTFPAGAKLASGEFLVVARDPEALRSQITGTRLFGPFEGSLHGNSLRLQLRDEFGALLLETRMDSLRGLAGQEEREGYSWVLGRPSFGEGNPRAWKAGTVLGGTPGRGEARENETMPDGGFRAGDPADPVPEGTVVVNELLVHSITGNDREQYVELFNPGNVAVLLEGWRLSGDIEFEFPRGRSIPAGGFLVVARDPRNLQHRYPALHRGNCIGHFSGTLGHSAGTVRLQRPDRSTGGWRIVSEAVYQTGGRSGRWSDGGGSSLELIHPSVDPRRADSWRDSDESTKSEWTRVEFQGRVGQGIGLGAGTSLHLYLLGEGECLVDDVEVRVDGGTNRVMNGGFDAGLSHWRAMGAMDLSSVEPDPAGPGQVLHLRAGSRGDPGANKLATDPIAAVQEGDWVTLRCRARWLRGWPELLLRLQGGGAEATGTLRLPTDLGTPGLPNSRRVKAAGPAIWNVRHEPPVPSAGESVEVSAWVEEARGVDQVLVRYRIDPSPEFQDLRMRRVGTAPPLNGAARYVATLPAQPAGTLVAFHLVTMGKSGGTNTFPGEVFPRPPLSRLFPGDSLSHECLVRFGDLRIPGRLSTYRLWMTRANRDRWIARDRLNNADLDATLIYDDQRVIYNVGAQAAGSPWHVEQMAPGPDGPHRFDYVVHLPKDEPLLGETDLNLVIPGNGDGPTSSDLSALSEPVSLLVFRDLGLPSLHRRFIRLVVNGSERSAVAGLSGHFVYEDVQQPNSHALRGWFPGVGHGKLFKIEDWFEFTNSVATVFENKDADLIRRVIPGTTNLSVAPYRFMWRLRGLHPGESASDYRDLFELIHAVSPTVDPKAPADADAVERVADLDQWFRVMACQRALGNWDSYGWERGKNGYLFRPPGGRFVLIPWDVDATLALGGRAPDSDLFAAADPRLEALLAVPRWRRSYLRALAEVAEGPLRAGRLENAFDEWTAALQTAGVATDSSLTEANKAYLRARRVAFQAELARHEVAFMARATRNQTTWLLSGKAAPRVASLELRGRPLSVLWSSPTEWTATLPAGAWSNGETLEVVGFDRFGRPIPGGRAVVTP